jgi:hypothetical protein
VAWAWGTDPVTLRAATVEEYDAMLAQLERVAQARQRR